MVKKYHFSNLDIYFNPSFMQYCWHRVYDTELIEQNPKKRSSLSIKVLSHASLKAQILTTQALRGMIMDLTGFYRLSAVLTGFNEAKLQGTGVGDTYYDVLTTLIPPSTLTQLQETFNALNTCQPNDTPPDAKSFETEFRNQILSSEELGPVARNILKMWYTSIWYPMPSVWTQQFGAPTQSPEKYQDVEFIISDDAYIQGLAWDAVYSHPMGAKQPGWATWSFTPEDINIATRTLR